jgi:lysyl-tRNA synthetase class 2
MKRLIARHRVSLYQICKCFRNGESTGRLHSPEFTMLEYYTMDADYLDSLTLTEALFAALLERGPGAQGPADQTSGAQVPADQGPEAQAPAELRPPFLRITMEEAFCRWAGFSLGEAARRGTLEEEARRLGLDPLPGMDLGALYNLIFVHRVEPSLPKDRGLFLMDYPAFVPCLAKKRPGGETVERWELYIRGIEIANCYSEEGDGEEVRRYFESEAAVKERSALVPHRIDRNYWRLFRSPPFPRCSGVAMGLDRLIMALTGRSSIDSVLPFPMEE